MASYRKNFQSHFAFNECEMAAMNARPDLITCAWSICDTRWWDSL